MTPAPFLVPCLVVLRGYFDQDFPRRDHASDGWIADSHHAASSDHQPDASGAVRAIDIDADLNTPGTDLGQVFERLRGDDRLEYLIFDALIASRSHGWTWIEYTGTDRHTGHGHISARHDGTGWFTTAGWDLEDLPMDQATFNRLMDGWAGTASGSAALGKAVWEHKLTNAYSGVDQQAGTILRYVPSRSPHETTWGKIDALSAAEPPGQPT